MSILNNTTSLQEILEAVNNLPEASTGVELPELSNPANISEIFLNKEVIDENGKVKTGIFTIDTELNTQEDLLRQLRTALDGKTAGFIVDDVSKSILNGKIIEIRDTDIDFIRPYIFADCTSLTTASFPACTGIGERAFSSCMKLTTVSFPACVLINIDAFEGCTSLTTASFPACTSIHAYAFASCYSLASVSFPVCPNTGSYTFYHCSSLTSVSFPVCTSVDNGTFSGCTKLASISFPACTSIGNYAFNYCHSLSSLTLGASTVCTLANSNAFSLTPYAGYSSSFSGTPYIFVPESLISSYQAATNWTYFSSYFRAILEDDPTEEEI